MTTQSGQWQDRVMWEPRGDAWSGPGGGEKEESVWRLGRSALTVELPFQFGGGTEGQQPRLPGGQQWNLRARGCPKFTFSEVGFTRGSRETGQVGAGPGLGFTDANDL